MEYQDRPITVEQKRINNFTETLSQAVAGRTDTPFPNQLEISWTEAVSKLEELFQTKQIEIRSVPGTQKIKSGYYSTYQPPIMDVEFMAKYFVLAVEIPQYPNTDNPEYTNDQIAYLVKELLVQHEHNQNNPNRLVNLPKNYRLATLILPTGPGANYLAKEASNTSLTIPVKQESGTLPQPDNLQISEKYPRQTPSDIFKELDPDEISLKLHNLWAKLTPSEKRSLLKDKDNALMILSVSLGIKPMILDTSRYDDRIPSQLAEKLQLERINDAWINRDAVNHILNHQHLTYQSSADDLLHLLIPTADQQLTKNQIILRGLLLNYGYIPSKAYATFFTEENQALAKLDLPSDTNPKKTAIRLLENLNTPPEDLNFITDYFQAQNNGRRWEFVRDQRKATLSILTRYLSPIGFSIESINYILDAHSFTHLGDRLNSTLSFNQEKQITQETEKFLTQIGMNEILNSL